MSLNDKINQAFDEPLSEDKNKNSPEFDKKSYEADGGDSWIAPDRLKFLVELKRTESDSLLDSAKRMSMKIYQKINWPFALWYYRKAGGRL